ncbi:MAG TPA: anti-sigma factor [Bryobacteraceae bacterium]|nr:anti-sigma factor [Bryobacteraceae bacterium]
MACNGLGAVTYDRYVLGLLDDAGRACIESHIHEGCEACLQGLHRSMNLWVVFATTLDHAEPSEDFKSRLVNIAQLSKKVLTFPNDLSPAQVAGMRRSTLIAVTIAAIVLILGAWYAGQQSGRMDAQPVNAELNRLVHLFATTQVQLHQEKEKGQAMQKALSVGGRAEAINSEASLQRQLSEARAEADQYKAVLTRNREAATDEADVLAVLANPNVHLVALKPSKRARGSVAYALLARNSGLIFLGSRLPYPQPNHQFQLWLFRKEQPKVISAGVFAPVGNDRTVLRFENPSLVSNLSELEVTEEPAGGSSAPTGPKLFQVSGLAD